MRGLYAICDTETLARVGFSPREFSEAVLSVRPCALQLRAKDMSSAAAVALLRELMPLARAAGVPLYANDRPDAAVFAGCDGVHLGQSDLPVDVARSIAKGVAIGLSTHDRASLVAALAQKPDYVAMGPLFPTSTKLDAAPAVGLSGLAEAQALAARAGIPLVAIGGITLENAREVGALADAVAVISDLTRGAKSPADIAARARAYVDLLALRPAPPPSSSPLAERRA